jgi:hypothetical protein
MKKIISVGALLSMLTTTAFASKTLVDPKIAKIEESEPCKEKCLEWMIIDRLDQIEVILDEMRKNILAVEPNKG